MSSVSDQGWAIPKRKYFRYTFEQKKFLYGIFIEGEKSGKKKSPEETESLVRQHFKSTEMYVTVPQIRALFSSFSKKYREGTLTEPVFNTVEENDEITGGLDEDDKCVDDMTNTVDIAMSSLSTWDIGCWVVVKFGRQWYPGRIVPPVENENSDECYFVSCMMRK